MSINLYFSQKLETLAEKLCENIGEESRRKLDPFDSTVVLVPNPNLSRWLKIRIAQHQSIFMDVDFDYLESGLWTMLKKLDPTDSGSVMRESSHLEMILISIFQQMKPDDTHFQPFVRYLFDSNGVKPPDYARRLYQLAQKIALLFHEYEYHRGEMISQWLQGKSESEEIHLCQQQLYLRMIDMCRRGSFQADHPILSLTAYADQVFSSIESARASDQEMLWIHLFGLSQISRSHLAILEKLKSYYTLFIYTLNPCREFWEDVQTPAEKRWFRKNAPESIRLTAEEDAQGELFEPANQRLLALWGKPGRENIRLLCRIAEYDFHACFNVSHQPSKLLHAIQHNVLTLDGDFNEPGSFHQDDSVQICACPSVYREIETVYNSILYNLEQDRELLQTDIAVLVPDMTSYSTIIHSVFQRRPKSLTYSLIDSNAEIESVYGQAVMHLFRIAAGRFSRKEVFDFFLNPCFLERWQVKSADIETWSKWADALGIFHSYDEHEKSRKGYPSGNAFTWHQGLVRLRLSRIMSSPRDHMDATAAVGSSLCMFEGYEPFYDAGMEDDSQLESFGTAVETLQQCVRKLHGGPATGRQWRERFRYVCERLLVVPEGFKGEISVKNSLDTSLEALDFYDTLDHLPETKLLDIHLIHAFIQASLRQIPGSYGEYLTSGITISGMLPMRPIPFKIIYIMGMQEGNFPGKAETSSLDLRRIRRRIGDVSQPEKNGYLFLEILLSARQKLYLSYVSRDLQKDRDIQPCSLLNQLIDHIEKDILDDETFIISQIPFKGSSPRYLKTQPSTPGTDLMVNYRTCDRISCYRSEGLWQDALSRCDPDIRGKLQAFIPDLIPHPEHPENSFQHETFIDSVNLSELKRYVHNPVDQKLRKHLGIYDEFERIEDYILKEEEPFYSEFPVNYRLNMEPLKTWIDACIYGHNAGGQRPAPDTVFNAFYDRLQRNSMTPEGVFASIDRQRYQKDFLDAAERLEPVFDLMNGENRPCRLIRFGQGTRYLLQQNTASFPVRSFDPISIPVTFRNIKTMTPPANVIIHGDLDWVWMDGDKNRHCLVPTGATKKGNLPDKYIIEPVLFYLCCLCDETMRQWFGNGTFTVHLIYKNRILERTYHFDKDRAIAYLERLLADYSDSSTIEWLPFDAVLDANILKIMADSDPDNSHRQIFQSHIQDCRDQMMDFNQRLIDARIPGNALETAQQRLAVFFDTTE